MVIDDQLAYIPKRFAAAYFASSERDAAAPEDATAVAVVFAVETSPSRLSQVNAASSSSLVGPRRITWTATPDRFKSANSDVIAVR